MRRLRFRFIALEVDACLASDSRVDSREECGGNIDEADAALESGGGKSAHVGHYAATYINNDRFAGGTATYETVPYAGESVDVFGHVARRSRDDGIGERERGEHLGLDVCVGDDVDRSRVHLIDKRDYGAGNVVGIEDLLHGVKCLCGCATKSRAVSGELRQRPPSRGIPRPRQRAPSPRRVWGRL